MELYDIDISFAGTSSAEANVLAQELEVELREASSDIGIAIRKERQDAQDFGTTLILTLGTPVAVVVARSLSTFLKRNSGVNIRISRSGTVTATNLDSKDAARIAEVMAAAMK